MNETNFCCVRIAKVKTTDGVKKCENEHNRTNGYENRENINHDKTSHNTSMQNWNGSQNSSIEEVFQEQKKVYNKNHKRGLRKDAVHALDGVFILSKVNNPNAFARSCQQFMNENFPDCFYKLWAHVDEKTIHVHFMVCAIDKNGNCITDKTMAKQNLRDIQTKFAEICRQNGLEDIERGISKADRFTQNLPQNSHKSPWQYANECNAKAEQALEAEKLAKNRAIFAEKERDKAIEAQKEAEAKTSEILAKQKDEIAYLDYLKNEAEKLGKENAELAKKNKAIKDEYYETKGWIGEDNVNKKAFEQFIDFSDYDNRTK